MIYIYIYIHFTDTHLLKEEHPLFRLNRGYVQWDVCCTCPRRQVQWDDPKDDWSLYPRDRWNIPIHNIYIYMYVCMCAYINP